MVRAVVLFLMLSVSSLSATAKRSSEETIHVFEATAYCLKGITASGDRVKSGIIAVDPRVIPLGSLVEIVQPQEVAGIYKASDTGGVIKGKIIDIWVPNYVAAMNFGRKKVQLKIIKPSKSSPYTSLLAMVGTRYKWGGTGRTGVDCSGLVWSVFGNHPNGFARMNSKQLWIRFPQLTDTPTFGTLVFFKKRHVGIVIDSDTFIHASSSKGVVISNLRSRYWSTRIRGFRVLPQNCF